MLAHSVTHTPPQTPHPPPATSAQARALRRASSPHSRNDGRGDQARAAARPCPSAPARPARARCRRALEEATDVDQQPGEFRPDGVERKMHALARGDHRVGRGRGTFAATAAGGNRARPAGGRARHQMRAREIGAQALAGLQLMRLDQGAAIAPAPPREPGQRTFAVIDGDGRASEFSDDLALRQGQVARADTPISALGGAARRGVICVQERSCAAPVFVTTFITIWISIHRRRSCWNKYLYHRAPTSKEYFPHMFVMRRAAFQLSWPGIAVRRTACFRTPMSRPSRLGRHCVPKRDHRDEFKPGRAARGPGCPVMTQCAQ